MTTQSTPACPVEPLARRFSMLASALEDADQPPHGAARSGQIWDLIELIQEQAEWLSPRSHRGATFTALLLLQAKRDADVAREASDLPVAAKLDRKFERLGACLVEFLTAQAGATVADQGLSALEDEQHTERLVRAQFAS